MKYRLIIQEAEEGGFVGMVPEVPGAFTQGETENEVRENIKEAIQLLQQVRMDMAIKEMGKSKYKVEQLDL
ncbi:MAG: type II toxin-antitoxin system HicB family antitoxin [Bacteroidales bacterium]|nr:type II toxin-antitoxin system HicB family antitoxin [Bacteroidales bacterium]